jgi:hypothetical protein
MKMENLRPSISARHDVVDAPAKSIRGRRDRHLRSPSKVISQRLTRYEQAQAFT